MISTFVLGILNEKGVWSLQLECDRGSPVHQSLYWKTYMLITAYIEYMPFATHQILHILFVHIIFNMYNSSGITTALGSFIIKPI